MPNIDFDVKALSLTIQSILDQDKRTSIERASFKKPKQDFLLAIKDDVISILLSRLYSTSEQVALINNSIKKRYMFSKATYMKFLNDYMQEEYNIYKKNRHFATKANAIREAIALYHNSKKEYKELGFERQPNNQNFTLTLEDYLFFKENYYNAAQVPHVEKVKRVKKELNKGEGDKYKKTIIPASTIDDISFEKVKKTSTKKTPKTKELIETSDNIEDISIQPLLSIDTHLSEEEQVKQLQAWIDSNPPLIEVVEDQEETKKIYSQFSNREDRRSFMQARINSHDKFEEPFVCFGSVDIMKYADPQTYCKDKLLIVIEQFDDVRKKYYRYYQGKIYFLEKYGSADGSPTIDNAISRFYAKHYSMDMQYLQRLWKRNFNN